MVPISGARNVIRAGIGSKFNFSEKVIKNKCRHAGIYYFW